MADLSQELQDLILHDRLLDALDRARLLPPEDPNRLQVEELAAHTLSPEAYRTYYRDTMRETPYDEAKLFSSSKTLGVPRYDVLIAQVVKANAQSILDLGCFDGWGLIHLCKNGARGVGVDLNPEALSIARSRADKYNLKVRFVESSVETFSTRDRFEAVILSEILEHVLDPLACLKVGVKHLAPNGKVYISVPAMPPTHAKLTDAAMHLRTFTWEALIALAQAAGLPVLDHEDVQTVATPLGEGTVVERENTYYLLIPAAINCNRLMVFTREPRSCKTPPARKPRSSSVEDKGPASKAPSPKGRRSRWPSSKGSRS